MIPDTPAPLCGSGAIKEPEFIAEIVENPARFIPCGAYCYHPNEEIARGVRHIYTRRRKKRNPAGGRGQSTKSNAWLICPFWTKKTRRTGYCHFLDKSDRELTGAKLIDMVKACGVNPGYGYYFEKFARTHAALASTHDAQILRSIFETLAGRMFDLGQREFHSKELTARIKAVLKERKIFILDLDSTVLEIMSFIGALRGLCVMSYEIHEADARKLIWSILARHADIGTQELDSIAAGMTGAFKSEGEDISSSRVLEKALGIEALRRFRLSIVDELVMSLFSFYKSRGTIK